MRIYCAFNLQFLAKILKSIYKIWYNIVDYNGVTEEVKGVINMSVFTISDIGKVIGSRENLRERADNVRGELKEVIEARKNIEKPFTAGGIATWIGVDRRSRKDLMNDPKIAKTRNELTNLVKNKDKEVEKSSNDKSRDESR